MPTAIQPADRLSSVGEYYFSRKLKEVAQLRAKGNDIINLGIGSPDLMPHEKVIEALVQTANGPDNHGYQAYNGIKELRDGFAAFYKDTYDVMADPDTEILPLMGSKEGVLHVTLAFANPGDGVLVPNPGYAAYRSVANLVGVVPVSYNLKEEGGWQPDINEIKAMAEEFNRKGKGRVKVLWVNYPHMPTGAEADMNRISQLVEWCREEGVLMVNDNPYSLVLPRGEPTSVMKLGRGVWDCVVELNSLSKSHNMPGWRIGCVIGAPHFIKSILQVKSNFDSGMFKPLQTAAAAALTTLPPSFHEGLTAEYTARRDFVHKILDTLGCEYSRQQVGLFIWARCPSHWPSVEQKIDDILYKASVFLTPGSIFGTNGEGYIRISLCCSQKRLREASERIAAYQRTAKL